MELLYLLFSIFSTTLTTLALSLFLPFRLLFSSRAAPPSSVSLYQGTVWHQRRRPVHHSFNYSVRYALYELNHDSHSPSDHFSADEARTIAKTNGPVFLLTIPPSVGYEQNPLSIYYCYDIEGSSKSLKKCIAEVTNTPWGERVSFLFDPNVDVVAKPLHVSPFMDMHGSWKIKTSEPEDNLLVEISVQHPKLGNYFSASLVARRVPSSATDHALFFWLMPHKVALWIYWHALKLWWKKVQFIQHPRYSNPAYKEEAMARDIKLSSCTAFASDSQYKSEANPVTELKDRSAEGHLFKWRDAKWPWC
ncbi:hypothetical protein DCAR_0208914 [Daucus carota subsp. sativus]|uniref:DUF1365 domain-containing protein n=1 Tax=Daucus carota subsp. sativus TaxID=79200 RepID=A0A166EW75_DAUCS|nr:PREDICTED: uncharacterized protein LOC108206378 isoform X1 [Daucus carota subsp. sativus]WOG89676.1 hypothetical protein DCAR_0208914 [Daucus carota subsp. sativus]